MSLLRTSHLVTAAAGVMAVMLPYWLIRYPDPDVGARLPFDGAAQAAIAPPPIPTAALGGRLFLGGAQVPDSATMGSIDGGDAAAGPPAGATPPQLVGTAIGRRGRSVAIVRTATGESHMVAQGETVDGWRVTRIANARITITRDNDTRTLDLPRSQRGGTAGSTGQ